MIKFPIEYGIEELQGDQVAACECYSAMLEMEDHEQTMCIGEQRTTAEPIEELEEITLDESRPERMTRMGTLASLPIRQALAAFLRMNQDVFAWSHKDMPGIDPSVIVHRLNVNPAYSPIRQKKASVCSGARQGDNRRGQEATRSKFHSRSILPRLAGEHGHG